MPAAPGMTVDEHRSAWQNLPAYLCTINFVFVPYLYGSPQIRDEPDSHYPRSRLLKPSAETHSCSRMGNSGQGHAGAKDWDAGASRYAFPRWSVGTSQRVKTRRKSASPPLFALGPLEIPDARGCKEKNLESFSGFRQRLVQVGDDVVDMLDAHGYSHHFRLHARL